MEDGSGITAVRRPARAARAVRVAKVTADGATVVVGRNQNLVDGTSLSQVDGTSPSQVVGRVEDVLVTSRPVR